MGKLEKLRARLAEISASMAAINDLTVSENGSVRSLTEDESKKYDALKREAAEVQGAIARELEIQEQRAQADRLNQPAGSLPSVQVTREHNHNEEGEYRGFASIERGGLGDFMRCVAQEATGKRPDKRLGELRAATGANELVGSEGGYLAQSDHAVMLFDAAKNEGAIASQCSVISLSSNSISLNMLDETSLASGSQFGGITASWRAEAGTVSSSKPKFRQDNVRLGAIDALLYATEELLEDSSALNSLASQGFPKVLAWELDTACISGNGAGKPLGILNSDCLVTVAAEGGQTADTVNYENVDKMVDRLMVGSEMSAEWNIHPDVKRQLRNAIKIGTNTDFLAYMPAGGISGSQYDSVFGYPVKRLQQCKALGDVGDILLCDWSKYLLFRKTGVKASQSAHVAFLTSEMVFKWSMRVAGQPAYRTAITDAYGSTTRSPFVALAAR